MKQTVLAVFPRRYPAVYNSRRNYSTEIKDGFSFLSQFDAIIKSDASQETTQTPSAKTPFNFLSYIGDKQKYVNAVYKEAQECKNAMSNANCNLP
jgi:hypothetical protein